MVDERARLLNTLTKLPSRQASWLLLHCCAVPRMFLLLRTFPPDAVEPLASTHDASISSAFRQIFTILIEEDWDQNLH
eukprot:139593-Pyramimonas_sp.AAC.1